IRGRAGVAQVVANARSGRVLIAYTRNATIADELELVAARSARPIARAAPRAPGAVETIDWSAESIDAVARRLRSSVSVGLEPAEASARLDRGGANVTDDEAPASRLSLLADQLANVPTALLLGSTLVS